MQGLMPRLAVLFGVAAPAFVALRMKRRKKHGPDQSLTAPDQRAAKIRTHEQRETPWLPEQ